MGAGFLLLTRAMGPFNTFKAKLSVARKNKEEIDAIIGLYGMDYDIEINIARKYHDVTEYDVQLEMKKNRTYQK